MSKTPIDPVQLRRALGAFVTGVTVVTTRTVAGEPVGITVNSFNTVSLAPPLVLWSLSLRAASFDAFVQSTHFVVNILGAHQIPLSERFATTGGDKFTGVAWRRTLADMPLLDDTAASFTCRTVHRFPGGDHLILVGEVLAFEQGACAPLVYAHGRYTTLEDGSEADRAGAKSRKIIASR